MSRYPNNYTHQYSPIFICLPSFLNCNYSFSSVTECKDDETWTDHQYGNGKSKCPDMIPDYCNNFGEYSIEAKGACPKACGVCG